MADDFVESEDDSIYDEETREERLGNDELEGREDAFMRGYEEDVSKEKNAGDLGSELFGDSEEEEEH